MRLDVSQRSLAALGALLALLAVTPSGAARPDDPASIARAIQQRYDTVRDLRARFIHTYEGGLLHKTAVERGTVLFKRPGMMRWVYAAPERKEFVSDGVRLYAYVPEDRQVTVSALPSDDKTPSPAMFLAGRGDLTRDFVASAAHDVGPVPPGSRAVTLTPKTREADFEWMVVIVDATSLQIRGLISVDAQGGRSAFTFEDVRENTGATAKDFRFTIPRGVDVITNNTPDR
jgi:outer membrane lipoprotein carrier protein